MRKQFIPFPITFCHSEYTFWHPVQMWCFPKNSSWTSSMCSHNICCWLFFSFDGNRYGSKSVFPKKCSPWICWLADSPLPSIRSKEHTFSIAAWSQLPYAKSMFCPRLWNDGKTWPDCGCSQLWAPISRLALLYQGIIQNQNHWAMSYTYDFHDLGL